MAIFAECLEGFAHAHSSGIVRRDIPSTSCSCVTTQRRWGGTPAYMSPVQFTHSVVDWIIRGGCERSIYDVVQRRIPLRRQLAQTVNGRISQSLRT
jgi:hypothetical protein